MANYIYVLVHGLFFMRLNPDSKCLELIAPAVDASTSTNPHHLLGGVRGHLQSFNSKQPNVTVDWSQIGLEGPDSPELAAKQMPSTLDTSVLQFSIEETGLKGWSSKPENYAGRFVLPWPEAFYSIRHDYFERTFIYSKSRVGDAIKGRCEGINRNAEIGLITCLQYDYSDKIAVPFWWPDMNIHCYFQPCLPHDGVNSDLSAASNCFLNPPAFDLQMDASALNGIVTPRGRGFVPLGVDKDDDYSLEEDPDRPKFPCHAMLPENVSPANCPNFFVGP